MEQNKVRTYLLYAIGEIFLVVIGILIALQVNNWNEERLAEARTIKLLTGIQEELISDLKEVDWVIQFHKHRIEKATYALNLNPAEEPFDPVEFGEKGILGFGSNPFVINNQYYENLNNNSALIPDKYFPLMRDLGVLYQEAADYYITVEEWYIEHMESYRNRFLDYSWYDDFQETGEFNKKAIAYFFKDSRHKIYLRRFITLSYASAATLVRIRDLSIQNYMNINTITGGPGLSHPTLENLIIDFRIPDAEKYEGFYRGNNGKYVYLYEQNGLLLRRPMSSNRLATDYDRTMFSIGSDTLAFDRGGAEQVLIFSRNDKQEVDSAFAVNLEGVLTEKAWKVTSGALIDSLKQQLEY